MTFKNKIISNLKAPVHRTKRICEKFLAKKHEADFIIHNRRVWKDFHHDKQEAEILLEAALTASSIISFSYLANVLAKEHNAKIRAYVIENKKVNSEIYESFNAEVFRFSLSSAQLSRVEQLFREIYPTLKTKRDVENLKVEGVWIGELIYDSHLRAYLAPTIEIKAPSFSESLKKALGYYVYWRDYLDSHNVKSVIISHCVYAQYAVILRVAVNRGIPVYQVNATSMFLLDEEHLWAYTEFYNYPEKFMELPPEERKRGLKEAQERLERRFAGEVGVDMWYSSKSAFVRSNRGRVLRESSRIKVLIATHCFFDAPHPYGVALFPDFYEWMTFLGEISKKTNYDWYLKMHPDFLLGNRPIVEGFIKRYPKFTLLPSETSHLQIAEEGIDFALTVAGTIGFEYAALGVPVINAAMCNPHVAYDFNIHPKTVLEYERILLDLPNQKLDIDLNQVYEYYYMAFVNNVEDWLFKNYEYFLNEIGGYKNQFGPISYNKFMKEFSEQRHKQIIRTVERFIESKEFYLQRKHISPIRVINSVPITAK